MTLNTNNVGNNNVGEGTNLTPTSHLVFNLNGEMSCLNRFPAVFYSFFWMFYDQIYNSLTNPLFCGTEGSIYRPASFLPTPRSEREKSTVS